MSSAAAITAQNSNIQSSDSGFNPLLGLADFFIKYVYENPLKFFENSPTMKQYSLIAIHAAMIAILILALPEKLRFVSYTASFWLAFLILMVFLTNNLYDFGLVPVKTATVNTT